MLGVYIIISKHSIDLFIIQRYNESVNCVVGYIMNI